MRKTALEVDVVGAREIHEIDLSAANKLLDRIGAQQVVGRKLRAAPDRQAAGVDGLFPRGRIAMVLAQRRPDVAVGTHANAHQIAVGTGTVAEEVAVQRIALARLDQLIPRQGEAAQSKMLVAGLEQA